MWVKKGALRMCIILILVGVSIMVDYFNMRRALLYSTSIATPFITQDLSKLCTYLGLNF